MTYAELRAPTHHGLLAGCDHHWWLWIATATGQRRLRDLGDRARATTADVSRVEDVETIVATALTAFGGLDWTWPSTAQASARAEPRPSPSWASRPGPRSGNLGRVFHSMRAAPADARGGRRRDCQRRASEGRRRPPRLGPYVAAKCLGAWPEPTTSPPRYDLTSETPPDHYNFL